jgi:hypothetical protein
MAINVVSGLLQTEKCNKYKVVFVKSVIIQQLILLTFHLVYAHLSLYK